MKNNRALIIIVILSFAMFSQLTLQVAQRAFSSSEAPAVEWDRTYGTKRSENVWNSVIETRSGGFAVAGTSDFGTGNDADERFWLVKTDPTGNAEWNKTYGEQREVASSIVQTVDGGYAMAGDSIIGGYGNAWLVKTDSSGNMQWNRSYTEIGWATAWPLIQTNDGGYVMAGCKEYYDGWLMKTDANGTMQWSRSFVEVNNTQLQSVVQTNDGGYIAAGATQWPPFSGKVDAYVVKTDSGGNTTWSKEFSRTTGNDYGRSIVQTDDGGYAIAGETDHWGNADFWLIKTDASGNSLWDKTYGGTGWDGANSIVQTSDGGYALAGQTNSFGAGSNDLWVVKTDADGNMQWNQTYGGAGDDGTGAVGSSIVQTRDGGYALCGYTNSFSGDGSYEVWLIKLAGSGPKTWIVDDDGPADFSTIQEAINAASDGDTVFVRNGTYYENVVVNKTLNLRGENRNSTIVDGNNTGNVVTLVSNNANVSGFTFQHSAGALHSCIRLDHVSGCSIFSNTANNSNSSASGDGIFLQSSERNNISDNLVINTWDGITFWGSSNNTISGNTVVNLFDVGGTSIQFCYGSAFNQAIGNAFLGIAQIGIRCYQGDSGSNVLIGNRVENHYHGIYADGSSNNIFYHNSIVNNTINQTYVSYSVNVWDDGYPSGGNYWSDYVGVDMYSGPYQNETGSDGIGDTPYVIDVNNKDSYPFLQPNGWSENLTKLSFSLVPNPAYIGQTVTMVGNLTDRLGQPINNTKIDLYVNGTLSGTLFTNSSGWFAASAKVNIAGTYNVTAVCTAQNYYHSSNMERLVVYRKLDTKVSFTLSPNPVHVGQWVLMAGNLTDTYDNLIGNTPLELYVKTGAGPWQHIGNISTDSSGKIWAFGKVMSKGTYQIAVVYRGSYKHNLSYHIETLVVSP